MSIEFSCPGCQKLLRVADSAAGKKARCPDCGTISDVPQSSQSSGADPDFSSLGSSSSASPGESSWSTGTWSPGPETSQAAGAAPGGTPPSNNPFAQKPTPEAADNPFASPQQTYSSMSSFGFESIRERVKGPAICLLVVSCISVALSLLTVAFQLLIGAGAAIGPGVNNRGAAGPAELMLTMSFGIVPAIIQLGRAAFMIYGSLQMKNLENYSVAMATAIIAVIPCFSTCCLLDIPFGIWALVVLNDAPVKQAFTMARR